MKFILGLSLLSIVSAERIIFPAPPAVTRHVGPLPTLVIPRQVAAPQGFSVSSIGVNGSGCPVGTTSYTASEDSSSVQITFNAWKVKSGPGIAISESRKFCGTTLGVKIPAGYSFRVQSIANFGFYQLDKGVSAVQTGYYYFQGEVAQGDTSSEIKGPVDAANYTYFDNFDDQIWSSCGGDTVLNVGASLRIADHDAGSGSASRVFQNFNLEWRRC